MGSARLCPGLNVILIWWSKKDCNQAKMYHETRIFLLQKRQKVNKNMSVSFSQFYAGRC